MNTKIEEKIIELTPKYSKGMLIYIITAVFLVLGVVYQFMFFIGAVIFGLFTVMVLLSTKKQIALMAKLKEDYEYNQEEALKVIQEQIMRVQKRIEVNERKAHSYSREGRDSARDAERALQEQKKWVQLKQMINQLHEGKLKDPFQE